MGPVLVHLALVLLLGPLLLGVIGRTKAFLAGRAGSPLLQPYAELRKLVRKGSVYSRTTTWVFRAGPLVSLAAVLVASLLLPLGPARPAISFAGDFVLFAALLALGRFALAAAALDTGSALEGMGASREAAFSALAEPALFLVFLVLARCTGETSLGGILTQALGGAWAEVGAPALLLAAGALFVVALAENARIPVDDPATHLELTMIHEVMVLDHSGPDLGAVLAGSAAKLLVLGSLLVQVVLPVRTGSAAADATVFLAGLLGVAILVGIVESTMARLRLGRVPHLLLAAGVLAAFGLAVAVTRG